jgi:hypothetical protein
MTASITSFLGDVPTIVDDNDLSTAQRIEPGQRKVSRITSARLQAAGNAGNLIQGHEGFWTQSPVTPE